jgi:arsenate reductase
MAKVTIYHNPRCSKSRCALKILQDEGIEPEVVLYLDDPPSSAKLAALIKQAGIETTDLVRRSEKVARELGIGKKEYSDRQLIDLMVKHPVLIERPIVVKDKRAVVARPPERVRELI